MEQSVNPRLDKYASRWVPRQRHELPRNVPITHENRVAGSHSRKSWTTEKWVKTEDFAFKSKIGMTYNGTFERCDMINVTEIAINDDRVGDIFIGVDHICCWRWKFKINSGGER